MAGVAGRGHEGVLGLSHVERPEGAHGIGARGVAGAAIGAREVRDVRGREHRILGRVIVEPGERGEVVAMALAAVAADAGVQHGVRGERRRRVVAGRRGMAGDAAQVARIRHVPRGQRGALPVRRRMAQRAVAAHHARIGALDVIGRPQLQRRAAADVEALARVVASIAGGGHGFVRRGTHRGGGTEAAGGVGGAMAGAAIGSPENGNVRRRERRFLGRRHAGNRHGRVGRRHTRESLAAMA